jgi:hypothetical protein
MRKTVFYTESHPLFEKLYLSIVRYITITKVFRFFELTPNCSRSPVFQKLPTPKIEHEVIFDVRWRLYLIG